MVHAPIAVCSCAVVYVPGPIVATPAAHDPVPFAGLTATAGVYAGSTPTAGILPVRLHVGAGVPGSTTIVPVQARRAQTPSFVHDQPARAAGGDRRLRERVAVDDEVARRGSRDVGLARVRAQREELREGRVRGHERTGLRAHADGDGSRVAGERQARRGALEAEAAPGLRMLVQIRDGGLHRGVGRRARRARRPGGDVRAREARAEVRQRRCGDRADDGDHDERENDRASLLTVDRRRSPRPMHVVPRSDDRRPDQPVGQAGPVYVPFAALYV